MIFRLWCKIAFGGEAMIGSKMQFSLNFFCKRRVSRHKKAIFVPKTPAPRQMARSVEIVGKF